MSLRNFNTNQVLKTCGLVNTGSICYLNSFLQSLMSCTSITEFFFNNDEKFTSQGNKVAIEYIKLLKRVKDAKSYSDVMDPSGVFREILIATKKKFPDKKFGRGQEDAGEGLTLFLDAIDDRELYTFFMYKYSVKTWCLTCVSQISEMKDESCILEIPPQFKGLIIDDDAEDVLVNPKNTEDVSVDPLNAHIRQYISVLDDYTCAHCKLQKCCRIYQLASAPEIITVMFNKYRKKTNIHFPTTLSFPSSSNTTINYRMVAKIEHSGDMGGGHYWAHCLRSGDSRLTKGMYALNDSNVSQGTATPSPDTYIVFYHSI